MNPSSSDTGCFPQDQGTEKGTARRGWVMLVLILVVAAGVRLWNIGARDLWLDEYLTIGGSNSQIYSQFELPTGEVVEHPPDYLSLSAAPPWYYTWTHAQAEVHPPLFYTTLRFWRMLTIDTDSWNRVLSVLFELIAITMLYVSVKTQAGATPALWAALLMSLAGVQIDYSQEVRSYTMLLAELLTAYAGMLLIERYGFSTRRALLLGIGSLLAVLTHYLSIPILSILALYAFIRLSGETRKKVFITFIVAGIAFGVLWGPFGFAQHKGFLGKLWHTIDPAWAIKNWALRIAELPARFLVNLPAGDRPILAIGAVLYIVPLVMLRRNPTLLLWTMVLILGTAIDAGGDLWRHAKMLETPRYTMPVSFSIYAIAGLLLANLSGWRRHIVPAALALMCAILIPQAYSRFKANWRAVGTYINANFDSRDMLVMNDPIDPEDPEFKDWRIRADYLSMNYYMRRGFPSMVFLRGAPTPQVRQQIALGKTIWFFWSYNAQKNLSILPDAKFTPALKIDGVGTLERVELPSPAATTASHGN